MWPIIAGIVLGSSWSAWRWWRGTMHVRPSNVVARCTSVAQWRRYMVWALGIISLSIGGILTNLTVLHWHVLMSRAPSAVALNVATGAGMSFLAAVWMRCIMYVFSHHCRDEVEAILRERAMRKQADGASGARSATDSPSDGRQDPVP
jgi:hypothetical protein